MTPPLHDPARQRATRIMAALLVIAAAPRLAILATGQRWLRSDEALVGLMSKRIITHGELGWFLPGQSYGGGHAISAILMSPFTAWLGPRSAIVNALPMLVSLVNVALLWLLLRNRTRPFVAVSAVLFYALAPAVMYQSFLSNGGEHAFLLGLVALHALARIGHEGRLSAGWGAILGASCGLACYAMDYAAVYPLLCGGLLLWRWRGFFRSKAFIACLAGGLLGLAPLIIYNATHDLAHLRYLLRPPPQAAPPLPGRALQVLGDLLVADGPVLFTTTLDDFPAAVSWAAVASFAILIISAIALAAARTPASGEARAGRDIEVIALAGLGLYIVLYCVSTHSATGFRAPRYLIPLYPFAAVVMAAGLDRLRRMGRLASALALAAAAFVIGQNLAEDWRMATARGHEEHRVFTAGASIPALASWLETNGVTRVFAPYEIQMRLIAFTNERVLVSCVLGPRFFLSWLPRMPVYDQGVGVEAALGQKPFAVVFRRDFAFAALAPDPRVWTREAWESWLASQGVHWRTTDVGEYVIYHDFSSNRFIGWAAGK